MVHFVHCRQFSAIGSSNWFSCQAYNPVQAVYMWVNPRLLRHYQILNKTLIVNYITPKCCCNKTFLLIVVCIQEQRRGEPHSNVFILLDDSYGRSKAHLAPLQLPSELSSSSREVSSEIVTAQRFQLASVLSQLPTH